MKLLDLLGEQPKFLKTWINIIAYYNNTVKYHLYHIYLRSSFLRIFISLKYIGIIIGFY